jgi:tagatose-6-phosphate ketose/aldose isomerase
MNNLFGLNPVQLEKSGAQWTAREILQQPGIWQELEGHIRSDAESVGIFLAPLLQRADLRIVLTGAGTSAYIGMCLAPALVKHCRRAVSAIATTDITAGAANYLLADVPTLLVSFARSGNSPESEAALDLAESCVAECYHLIVTCNAEGALYRRAARMPNARVILLPEETNDRSFAMTSSFSAMLLAAALTFKLPLNISPDALAEATREQRDSWLPRIQNIVAERFERIIYLGANELQGLARESALKMLELTDGNVVSMADTPLGFRHGPKTILNSKALVVLFLANDRHGRRYDLDLLSELRAEAIAGRVLAVMARHDGSAPHADDVLVGGLDHASDLALCLPYAVFAQSLALMQSLALGMRPDSPNAAGTVSRVVKGVSIYRAERTV